MWLKLSDIWSDIFESLVYGQSHPKTCISYMVLLVTWSVFVGQNRGLYILSALYLKAEQSSYSNPNIISQKITTKLTLIHSITNSHAYRNFDRSILWPPETHLSALGGPWKSYMSIGSQWTHYHWIKKFL